MDINGGFAGEELTAWGISNNKAEKIAKCSKIFG
jgi:hypothetical protein